MSIVPLRFAPAPPIEAVMTVRVKPAAIWEQMVVTLWVFSSMIVFPGNSLILYPCALILILIFVHYSEFTVPLALKCAILMALPVMALLSSGWSASPDEAFRHGILMVLNFLGMITIATRLTRRQIIRCVFFAGTMAVLYLAPHWNILHFDSFLGSKNFLAIRMLITTLTALAVALDSDESYALRVAALLVSVVALVFCYLGASATALGLALGGIGVLTIVWLVWQPATRIRHLRSFVIISGIAAMFAGVMVLLSMPNITIVDDILGAFGKDATLTNRTLLWEAGNRIADQRPMFGHGIHGFWLPQTGAAQTLNELDHRAPGTRHSFHNSFIEARVALGYVGLTILIAQLAWTMSMNLRAWFTTRGMPASYFLLIGIIILVTTFTESYMMGAFDAMIMLFYLAGITAVALPYHTGKRQRVLLRPA